jgi:hypothetical protein
VPFYFGLYNNIAMLYNTDMNEIKRKYNKLLEKIVWYSENRVDNMTRKQQEEYLRELKIKLKATQKELEMQ